MGADFIEKATPSFKKSWDRERVKLATPDLFTRQPDCAARTAAADIIGEARLQVGDRLTVELQDDVLVARRGNSTVARFSDPPQEVIEAMKTSHGIAKGTVEQVNDLSRVAEISLC